MNLSGTLKMLIGLARAQTKEKQAELAYRAAYDAGSFARNSKNWIDDEAAEFFIDNSDDVRQGVIDGMRGAAHRYDGDLPPASESPILAALNAGSDDGFKPVE